MTEKLKHLHKLIYGDDFQDFIDTVDNQLKEHNLFEIMGMGNQEIKHSRSLGWLLGSNNKFSRKIFKAFIKNFIETSSRSSDYPIKQEQIESLKEYIHLQHKSADYEVRYEYKNIDILFIDNENKVVIFIENKVWASESTEQLKKYREFITKESEFKNWKKCFGIYLTPDANEPDEKSTGAEQNREFYFLASYEDAKKAIEETFNNKGIQRSNEQIMIAENYLDLLIRNNIVANDPIEEFARKIWTNSDYKEALEILDNYKPDRNLEIQQILESYLRKQAVVNYEKDSNKRYVRFADPRWDKKENQLKGVGWTKSKRTLLYEFRNFNKSLTLTLVIGPGDHDFRQSIFDGCINTKNDIQFKASRKTLGDKWSQIYTKDILSGQKIQDLNLDITELKKTIEDKLDTFFSADGDFEKIGDYILNI